MDQVTLKPGDYVSTEGMTEEQYHAVAAAFMEAGAKAGEYPEWEDYAKGGYLHGFGWALDGRLYHGDFIEGEGYWADNKDDCRHLTIAQVLGAVNAEPATEEPAADTTIATLRLARERLQEAQGAYQLALDAVRAELGEGFVLSEVGEESVDDMSDPANWREGDLITATDSSLDITKGRQYRFILVDSDGDYEITGDDAGDENIITAGEATWHSRPR